MLGGYRRMSSRLKSAVRSMRDQDEGGGRSAAWA